MILDISSTHCNRRTTLLGRFLDELGYCLTHTRNTIVLTWVTKNASMEPKIFLANLLRMNKRQILGIHLWSLVLSTHS